MLAILADSSVLVSVRLQILSYVCKNLVLFLACARLPAAPVGFCQYTHEISEAAISLALPVGLYRYQRVMDRDKIRKTACVGISSGILSANHHD
jgi:hypothetical protein